MSVWPAGTGASSRAPRSQVPTGPWEGQVPGTGRLGIEETEKASRPGATQGPRIQAATRVAPETRSTGPGPPGSLSLQQTDQDHRGGQAGGAGEKGCRERHEGETERGRPGRAEGGGQRPDAVRRAGLEGWVPEGQLPVPVACTPASPRHPPRCRGYAAQAPGQVLPALQVTESGCEPGPRLLPRGRRRQEAALDQRLRGNATPPILGTEAAAPPPASLRPSGAVGPRKGRRP